MYLGNTNYCGPYYCVCSSIIHDSVLTLTIYEINLKSSVVFILILSLEVDLVLSSFVHVSQAT